MSYGSTIYGSGVYKYGGTAPVNNVNFKNGTCLRMGVKPEFGMGWSEYANTITPSAMVFPMPGSLPVTTIDANGRERYVMIDEYSGRLYEFPTYTGPAGSGVVETFLDKDDGNGGGAEIPIHVHHKEQSGPEAQQIIEHLQSIVHMHPPNLNTIGAAGYNAITGLRNAFTYNYGFHRNVDLPIPVQSLNIPDNGEIVFDRKVEGRHLQPYWETTASEFNALEMNTFFLNKDTSGSRSEKLMSEDSWQSEYGNPIVWFSRSSDLTMNLVDGSPLNGTCAAAVGMDGNTYSAMSLTYKDSIVVPITKFSGDFTIQFNTNNITIGQNILAVTTSDLSIMIDYDDTNSSYRLNYTDGMDSYSTLINWNGTAWTTIAIKRVNKDLFLYKDGVPVATTTLSYEVDIEGYFVVNPEAATQTLHDVRLYASGISADAIAYYYRNMTENYGNALLPLDAGYSINTASTSDMILIFTGAISSDWQTAGNWKLSTGLASTTIPSAKNILLFNASSPDCTLSADAICYSMDTTGYTKTISVGAHTLTTET